jgi:ABC-type polar amino acid transport system ATPase subunit
VDIAFRNVTKFYGSDSNKTKLPIRSFLSGSKQVFNAKIPALNDVSFSISNGDVVCFLGPSGSGKSTCLRVMAGLETIQSGTVVVGGEDYRFTKHSPSFLRARAGMIFQHFELFPHLNVLENVTLGLRVVQKLSLLEAEKIATDKLELVGMQDFQKRSVHDISGGQKQRVAIARALAMSPKLLLCDEPTSALDPALVKEVLTVLKLIAQQGTTLVIATHELNFAKEVSQHCFYFENGFLKLQQTTQDFFTKSAPKLYSSQMK